MINNQVLNKAKIVVKFHHERGVNMMEVWWKYEVNMMKVWGKYDESMRSLTILESTQSTIIN